MKPDLTAYLGRHVSVTIDRPLGSRHPRHLDIVYPVNYGFVPDTISGDGMEIDVYVLGVDVPIDHIECVVLAVVVRADDAEDKLVAAPAGHSYTAEQIADAVQFQERFFDSRVVLSENERRWEEIGNKKSGKLNASRRHSFCEREYSISQISDVVNK